MEGGGGQREGERVLELDVGAGSLRMCIKGDWPFTIIDKCLSSRPIQ